MALPIKVYTNFVTRVARTRAKAISTFSFFLTVRVQYVREYAYMCTYFKECESITLNKTIRTTHGLDDLVSI